MCTGHVFIAQSLDGYIARKDDTLDWLTGDGSEAGDSGYDTFMESVDGLIMGRMTYETVLGFGDWPYPKPVLVLSNTLQDSDIPEELSERIATFSGSAADVLAHLAAKGWTRAYVDGGQVIQNFLRDGLIKDMVVTTAPVLIGSGKPLFGSLNQDIRLKLTECRTFGGGFSQSTYQII